MLITTASPSVAEPVATSFITTPEIQDWAALGRHCDHVALLGKTIMFGPARHGPGFNVSTYMADPDGCIVEVYTDLLRINDDAAYTPVDWSTEPHALNLWGPGPTTDLLTLGVPCGTAPR